MWKEPVFYDNDNCKYAFNEDGTMVTGWYKFNESLDRWFYYDLETGKGVEGWKEIDGEFYNFDWNSELNTSQWIDNKYYVDENGKMLLNTQRVINGIPYIFDDKGITIKVSDYQNKMEQKSENNDSKKTKLQELKTRLQKTDFDDKEIKIYLEKIIDYTERIRKASSRFEKEQLYNEESWYFDQLKKIVNVYKEAQIYTGQIMKDVELVDVFLEEIYNS